MKLPPTFLMDTKNEGYNNTLSGVADWVEREKPELIEMTEHQFWQFAYLQPLYAGEERYWTTFHGIPIVCPEMKLAQQEKLRLKKCI